MSKFQMMRKSAVALIVTLGVQAVAGAASIVNIDIEGYRTAGGGIPNEGPAITYVGTGAAGGGNTFNGVYATAVSDNTTSTTTGDNQTLTTTNGLLDSNGTLLSGINFSIGPVGVDNENSNVSTSASTSLFSDYAFNNSAGNSTNATFSITGLTPGSYDVYLYAGFANTSNLANTAVTGGTLATMSSTGIFDSTNTRLYTVNVDSSDTINGTLGSGTQILAGLTVASVPEPATVSLIVIGALPILAHRRRNNALNQ